MKRFFYHPEPCQAIVRKRTNLWVTLAEQFEAAAKADGLKPVKGLGPALQRKILQGLEIRRATQGARHIHRAAELLAAAEKSMAHPEMGFTRITPAGDFRRGCELITNLAVVAEVSRKKVPHSFKTADLTVHITDKQHFGISLLLATGSEAHIAELQRLAKTKGLTLTTEGLRRGSKIIASETETGIYKALGLPLIPPELREGRGEIPAAQEDRLPELVSEQDIQGILHAHTQASDGVNSLQQMAEATRKRGYFYFGVADHSQSAGYAGGLSLEEIEEQHEQIDRLNGAYGNKFHIFKGIEADILPDGALDYSDDILRRFDFVVASVHSRFRMEPDAQTERVVRAVSNPHTTILGHMLGR